MSRNLDSSIKFRVPSSKKEKAQKYLERMGVSMSFAMQMAVHRIIEEKGLPATWLVPNKETQRAMRAAIEGDVQTMDDIDSFFSELDDED